MSNDLGKIIVAAIEASQKEAAERRIELADRQIELAKIKNPKKRAMVAEYIEVVLIEHRDGENQSTIAGRHGFSAATLRRHLPDRYKDMRKRRN